MRKIVVVISLALAVSLTRATGAGDLSHEKAVVGRKLYVAKCARCHKFYDPSTYDDTKWKHWMEKMRKKTKLGDEQYKLLTDYLQSIRVQGTDKSALVSHQ